MKSAVMPMGRFKMPAPVAAAWAWASHHPVIAAWAGFTALLAALAAQIEPHQTALAISLIGGATVGLIVLAIRSIGNAIIEQVERRAQGVSGRLNSLEKGCAEREEKVVAMEAKVTTAETRARAAEAKAEAADERFSRLAASFNERTARTSEAQLMRSGYLASAPLPEPEDSVREGHP